MKVPNKKITDKYLRNIKIVVLTAVLLLISSTIISSAQERDVTRKAVKVDPKILDAYTGDYQLAPNFILTISKEDNRLFAQATGQTKIEFSRSLKQNSFTKLSMRR